MMMRRVTQTTASVVKRNPDTTRPWFLSTMGMSATYHIPTQRIGKLVLCRRSTKCCQRRKDLKEKKRRRTGESKIKEELQEFEALRLKTISGTESTPPYKSKLNQANEREFLVFCFMQRLCGPLRQTPAKSLFLGRENFLRGFQMRGDYPWSNLTDYSLRQIGRYLASTFSAPIFVAFRLLLPYDFS